MELCMREKAVFFLPVNILTVWSLAFLAARHTTVCLDVKRDTLPSSVAMFTSLNKVTVTGIPFNYPNRMYIYCNRTHRQPIGFLFI